MRSGNRWIVTGLGLALAGLVAMPALAGKAYRYTAADGSVAYTDDLERIPESLRGSAKVIETTSLSGYGRLSPSHTDDTDARIQRLRESSERLRMMAAEASLEQSQWNAVRSGGGVAAAPAPVAAGAGGGFQATVEVNGATINLPNTNRGDGPIVVEQVRAIRKGKNVTQEATVVRQGDEVLMVVYPEPHLQTNFNDFVREDEILDGRR